MSLTWRRSPFANNQSPIVRRVNGIRCELLTWRRSPFTNNQSSMVRRGNVAWGELLTTVQTRASCQKKPLPLSGTNAETPRRFWHKNNQNAHSMSLSRCVSLTSSLLQVSTGAAQGWNDSDNPVR